MPEVITKLLEQFGVSRRALLVAGGISALLVVIALTRVVSGTKWVPIFREIPLEEVGGVTRVLDEARIGYKVENGGTTLLVAESDLAKARVALASEGVPTSGAPGLELFDQSSWGMTDFAQKVNYRRALEGELERTISRMRDVQSASVHLALRESRVFRRDERPIEASVVLSMRRGIRPSAALVEGITYLVAGSVDGLLSEHVTVLDDTGRLLSASLEEGSAVGLASRQLGLRREIEHYLEVRAEELVAEAFGAGRIRVRVAAELNFNQLDRTVRSIDPAEQFTLSEERTEITPSEGQIGAGQVASKVEYTATQRLEQFTSSPGSIKRLTVAVLVDENGTAPDVGGWTDGHLVQVESLVRHAVGLDSQRGDEISVVRIPFNKGTLPESVSEEPMGFWLLVERFRWPIVLVIGLILLFILARQALKAFRPAETSVVAAAEEEGEEILLEPGETLELPEPVEDTAVPHDQPIFPEVEGRARVAAMVESRPESAARMLRIWLREG